MSPNFEYFYEKVMPAIPEHVDFEFISYVSVIEYPTDTYINMHKDSADEYDTATAIITLDEDYTGGSFSISNLGMYGIEEFSAIINPPQAGIIAIGDILEDVNVFNGEFKVCKTMSYVLSVDHRIVDGAIASKLLKYFKFFINNPSAMLI